jgi:hypothetical protein
LLLHCGLLVDEGPIAPTRQLKVIQIIIIQIIIQLIITVILTLLLFLFLLIFLLLILQLLFFLILFSAPLHHSLAPPPALLSPPQLA